MSRKFFAMAKSDNSFIVSADTEEALTEKIAGIRQKHPDYYKKYIIPGYYVVEADNIKESKSGSRSLAFDLPLFTTATFEYQLLRAIPETREFELISSFPDLQKALQACRKEDDQQRQIRVRDNSGRIVKTLPETEISRLLAEHDAERHKRLNGQQLKLF